MRAYVYVQVAALLSSQSFIQGNSLYESVRALLTKNNLAYLKDFARQKGHQVLFQCVSCGALHVRVHVLAIA